MYHLMGARGSNSCDRNLSHSTKLTTCRPIFETSTASSTGICWPIQFEPSSLSHTIPSLGRRVIGTLSCGFEFRTTTLFLLSLLLSLLLLLVLLSLVLLFLSLLLSVEGSGRQSAGPRDSTLRSSDCTFAGIAAGPVTYDAVNDELARPDVHAACLALNPCRSIVAP